MRLPVERVDCAVHGIQRGGNHAVINWILGHFRSHIFYNCCSVDEGSVSIHEQDLVKKGEGPYEFSLASFEDIPEKLEESSTALGSPKVVIVIRDFYNTYASRFEKQRKVKSSYWLEKKWKFYDDTSKWKTMAKKMIDIGENCVGVNYNMWFSSKQYRASLSKNFGEFSDDGLGRVLHFGGGSSFDGREYDGRAGEMKVLGRWEKYYKDREYLEKVVSDEEAREINRIIFGSSIPRLHL